MHRQRIARTSELDSLIAHRNVTKSLRAIDAVRRWIVPGVPRDTVADRRGRVRRGGPQRPAGARAALTDPREADPLAIAGGEPRDGPDSDELITSFLELRRPKTSALLTAIAELLDDELASRRITRELAGRSHKPPRWLRRLDPVRVEPAIEMGHVLGDGDNLMLDVVTGTGHHLAVMVYIDHNLGTLVKDAFVVEEPLEALHARFAALIADEPDATFAELDLADARARITEAIVLGAITHPPFETDTWPACRPLVEWVMGHLPEGGTGYARPEWAEKDRAALIDRFLDSEELTVDDLEAAEDLTHVFVWFASDYGPGDPLRWSQVSVEILLTPRADPMLRAIDAPASGGGTVHLGSPRYLVSTKRERIADLRERWR